MNIEIKRHIDTGRDVVVINDEYHLDVLNLVASLWKHNPTIVTQGMYQGLGLKAEGTVQ